MKKMRSKQTKARRKTQGLWTKIITLPIPKVYTTATATTGTLAMNNSTFKCLLCHREFPDDAVMPYGPVGITVYGTYGSHFDTFPVAHGKAVGLYPICDSCFYRLVPDPHLRHILTGTPYGEKPWAPPDETPGERRPRKTTGARLIKAKERAKK